MNPLAAGERWRQVADSLDFAFQPIVDIRTGDCGAYEALLRGWDDAGFSSINAVFDAAHEDLALYQLDLLLREKVVAKFMSIPHHHQAQLFYNLDNRILEMPDYAPGNTAAILARYGMPAKSLCFEVSERYEFQSYALAREVLTRYKDQSYLVALDDFGAGFSGLQMLYHCEPGFLKIDRFFVAGVETDLKKRVIVAQVVKMAHTFGMTVIAEGVETEDEFRACREIGCDLVQGYLIQSPTLDVADLLPTYTVVGETDGPERRHPRTAERILIDWIDRSGVPASAGVSAAQKVPDFA